MPTAKTVPTKPADVPSPTPPPPANGNAAPEANETVAPEAKTPTVTVGDFDFDQVPSARGRSRKLNPTDKMVLDYVTDPAPRIVDGLETDEEINKFAAALRNSANRLNDPKVKLIWRYVPENLMVGGKPHPAAGKHVWKLVTKDGENDLPSAIERNAASK